MEEFNIVLASVPDRQNLVSEIWYNKHLLCEISNEKFLEIEFYNNQPIKLDYQDFMRTLEEGKNKLINSDH